MKRAGLLVTVLLVVSACSSGATAPPLPTLAPLATLPTLGSPSAAPSAPPTPAPTASAAPSVVVTPAPTAAPTATPAPTAAPTATPAPTPQPTATPEPTESPSPSATEEPSPSDSEEPSPSASGAVDPESEAALRASLLTTDDIGEASDETDVQITTSDTTTGFDDNNGERVASHDFTGTDNITMVYDFRWQFPTKSAARAFLIAANEELSESSTGLKTREGAAGIGDQWFIYSGEDAAGLGLMFYNYLFRVNNVVAKVFVAGAGDKLTSDMADEIAVNAEGNMSSAIEGEFPNETEAQVLQYVPENYQATCRRVFEFYVAEVNSVRCVPTGKPRLDYSLFTTTEKMDAAFDSDLKGTGAVKSGQCSNGKYMNGYTLDGVHAGRWACIQGKTTKYIEWTDEDLNVLSYFSSPTATWAQMQDFWNNDAGPIRP